MNKLDEMLIQHHIVPGYMGYNYIKHILQSDIDLSNCGIVSVYEDVAVKYNTKGSRVERAIRHILSKSDLDNLKNKLALAYLQVEYKGMM